MQVSKSMEITYWPIPPKNRQCEWYNHALIYMLGTLPPNLISSGRDMVLTLVHVYNCTKSTATGFSAYYLMYGW